MIGGLKRLETHYRQEARKNDIDLRVLNQHSSCLKCKLAKADAVILFTNAVSHQAAKEVYKLAREKDVCLIRSHRSSVSAARLCFGQLRDEKDARIPYNCLNGFNRP